MIRCEDAAEMLGCSKAHLQRLARRREIEGGKVGRDWVFTEDAVHALLRKRTVVQLAPTSKGRKRNSKPRL